MALPEGMEPTVTRDGNKWRISLGPRASTHPEGLPVDAQRDFPLGARLVVGVPDARQVIQMNDPVVGDQLLVVPLPNPGQTVADPHGFSQLRLLPAAQGIVVQPLEDNVAVRPIRDGVEVTAAGGLRLSPPGDVTGVSATRLSGRGREPAPASGLFDLAKWRGGPASEFTKLRQKAQQAVLSAPEVERDRARLDLAHFYFAHGWRRKAWVARHARRQPARPGNKAGIPGVARCGKGALRRTQAGRRRSRQPRIGPSGGSRTLAGGGIGGTGRMVGGGA